MGYGSAEKVSKKVSNVHKICTKIPASFFDGVASDTKTNGPFSGFTPNGKNAQVGCRAWLCLLMGEFIGMEALNPSLETSESELLQQAGAGCKESFYGLVKPCERALFAAAMGILNNEADAEEAAQEAVLKAFTNISRFRRECKFSTWIIQICINEARLKNGEDGNYFPRDFADWREIPSEALERKELRDALQRAMASLPEKYREVLILRDIQHLSIEETAQVLGIGTGNVKTRLLRARLQMRDALAPGIDGNWSLGRQEYTKVRAW